MKFTDFIVEMPDTPPSQPERVDKPVPENKFALEKERKFKPPEQPKREEPKGFKPVDTKTLPSATPKRVDAFPNAPFKGQDYKNLPTLGTYDSGGIGPEDGIDEKFLPTLRKKFPIFNKVNAGEFDEIDDELEINSREDGISKALAAKFPDEMGDYDVEKDWFENLGMSVDDAYLEAGDDTDLWYEWTEGRPHINFFRDIRDQYRETARGEHGGDGMVDSYGRAELDKIRGPRPKEPKRLNAKDFGDGDFNKGYDSPEYKEAEKEYNKKYREYRYAENKWLQPVDHAGADLVRKTLAQLQLMRDEDDNDSAGGFNAYDYFDRRIRELYTSQLGDAINTYLRTGDWETEGAELEEDYSRASMENYIYYDNYIADPERDIPYKDRTMTYDEKDAYTRNKHIERTQKDKVRNKHIMNYIIDELNSNMQNREPMQLYRGLKENPFEGLEPGDIIQDPAFMSTSAKENMGKAFADWNGGTDFRTAAGHDDDNPPTKYDSDPKNPFYPASRYNNETKKHDPIEGKFAGILMDIFGGSKRWDVDFGDTYLNFGGLGAGGIHDQYEHVLSPNTPLKFLGVDDSGDLPRYMFDEVGYNRPNMNEHFFYKPMKEPINESKENDDSSMPFMRRRMHDLQFEVIKSKSDKKYNDFKQQLDHDD